MLLATQVFANWDSPYTSDHYFCILEAIMHRIQHTPVQILGGTFPWRLLEQTYLVLVSALPLLPSNPPLRLARVLVHWRSEHSVYPWKKQMPVVEVSLTQGRTWIYDETASLRRQNGALALLADAFYSVEAPAIYITRLLALFGTQAFVALHIRFRVHWLLQRR